MMMTTGPLLQLLLTALCVVVSVSGSEYIDLSALSDGDLAGMDRTKTARDAGRSVVKRASLDDRSRPSNIKATLNSLRRQKHASNMYYVVRSKIVTA